MGLSAWFSENSTVAVSGTAELVDIANAASMPRAASGVLIINDHGTAVLSITFSQNGTDFTADAIVMQPNTSITVDWCDCAALKIDTDISGSSYQVLAWIGRR